MHYSKFGMNLGPARPVIPVSELSKYKKQDHFQSPITRASAARTSNVTTTGIIVD